MVPMKDRDLGTVHIDKAMEIMDVDEFSQGLSKQKEPGGKTETKNSQGEKCMKETRKEWKESRERDTRKKESVCSGKRGVDVSAKGKRSGENEN